MTVPEHQLRILVWYWGRRGGGARYTLELAQALAARPDCCVLVAVAASNELLDEVRSLTGVEILVGEFHPSRARPVVSWHRLIPGRWSLGGWARRHNVDVVLQTMGHPLSALGAFTVAAARLPLVHTIHDAHDHPGDRHRLLRLADRAVQRSSTRIVALTEVVKAELVASGMASERIDVIAHGPLFAGVALPRRDPNAVPTVLLFGRLRAYKGLDLLLEAWPLVRQALPLAELQIVGDGPLALGQLPSGVHVDRRWVPDHEVAAVFADADVVVLPYVEASQSGVATIALSFGRAIVATDVGGLREQLGGKPNVTICPPDVEPLAMAIVAALTDAKARVPKEGSDEVLDWTEIAGLTVAAARRAARASAQRHRLSP